MTGDPGRNVVPDWDGVQIGTGGAVRTAVRI